MKHSLISLHRALIVLFCVFHMAAVALYAIPARTLRIDLRLRAIIEPYIFTVSQWQGWDLFSPNPLENQSFRIEERAEGYWKTSIALSHANLGWWRSVQELKIVTRLAGMGDRADPILDEYIAAFCPALNLEPGRYIRLILSRSAHPDRILTETQCRTSDAQTVPIRFLQAR